MTGFVYKWTNTVNNKWYIGSHKGTINDGYRHTSNIVLLAEEKHGIENFNREILYTGNDYRDIEAKLLAKINAANNLMSYNRCNIVGSRPLDKESAKRQKDSQLNRWKEIKSDPKRYKNVIENMRKGANNRSYEPLKGKTYEEIHGVEKAKELRQKRSSQQKNSSVVKGKTWEELYGAEQAAEMKEAARLRMINNNPNIKRKYYERNA